MSNQQEIEHEEEVNQVNHFQQNQQPLHEESRELVANGHRNAVNNNIAAEAQNFREEPREPRNDVIASNNRKVVPFLNKSLAKITEFVGDLVNSKTLLKYSADLGSIKSLHKLADICYKEENYDEAEKLYTILAEVHQNSHAMYMLAAISLEVRNNLDATIVWYKWAIAADDQNFSAITSLAKIYYAQGMAGQVGAFKEAYELLKSAFPAISKFVFGKDEYKNMHFGDKYHEQYFEKHFKIYKDKNPSKTIDDFIEVLNNAANQRNGSAMLALASYYFKDGDYRRAYEFGRQAYRRAFLIN